jgi:acetoin utilization protein AcuB
MSKQPSVSEYMSVAPHFVGLDQSLAVAARRMRELRARHLPVLEDGRLRGILSERDIALAEAFGLDPHQVSVEEAMSSDPYTVDPHTPLGHVARAMAAHKYGCAVVAEGSELRGVFTTTDALRALADTLDAEVPEPETVAPSQVREMMGTEHAYLHQLLEHAVGQAHELLSGAGEGDREIHALRDAARQLYSRLKIHSELENKLLVPVLKQTDAWGPMRAERLLDAHARQMRALEAALMELDDLNQPPQALARHLQALAGQIQDDLAEEERDLLTPELLSDDLIIDNPETD